MKPKEVRGFEDEKKKIQKEKNIANFRVKFNVNFLLFELAHTHTATPDVRVSWSKCVAAVCCCPGPDIQHNTQLFYSVHAPFSPVFIVLW